MHKHAHTHTNVFILFLYSQSLADKRRRSIEAQNKIINIVKTNEKRKARSNRTSSSNSRASRATIATTTAAARCWKGAGVEARAEAECKSQSPFRSPHTGCFCGAHSKCGNCKLQKIYFKEATNNNNNNNSNSNNNENNKSGE